MSADFGDETPVEVDRGPARVSSALATVAAGLAVLLTAPLSTFALPLGTAGFVVFVVALFVTGSRSLLWLGSVVVFAGAVVAGTVGAAPPAALLSSVAATILAWDVGQNAISVGEQLGRGAATWRGEVVHAAASTVVAVLVAGVAYAVFRVGDAGQPALALVLLLAAGVLLTWAFRA